MCVEGRGELQKLEQLFLQPRLAHTEGGKVQLRFHRGAGSNLQADLTHSEEVPAQPEPKDTLKR